MTIYSLYILFSILATFFLTIYTFAFCSSLQNRLAYTALAGSILGIFAIVFLSQVSDIVFPEEKWKGIYHFFSALATFSFLNLSLIQENFTKRERRLLVIFGVNTGFILVFLGVNFLGLPFQIFPPEFAFFYSFVSQVIAYLFALTVIYQKFHILAELDQARLSSYFISSLIFFLAVLWNKYIFKSTNFHLMCFLFLPFLWILSQLIVRKRVILIEGFLKDILLKAACIGFYFYCYILLKYYIIVPIVPLNDNSHFFFSGYLFFTFLTYPSVEKFFHVVFKKTVFRPLVNYHLLFQSFSSVILSMVDPDKITDMAVKMFYDAYGMDRVSIFMLISEKQTYKLQTAIGAKLEMDLLSETHPLIKHLKGHFRVIARKEAMGLRDRRAGEFFRATKSEICIPLEAKRTLIGFLLLGRKTDGSSYTQEDMKIFDVMEGQISVALNNALFFKTERESFELMAQRNKMDAVIALSGGVNHEINNPLSIISMKCQNFLRKVSQNKFASPEEALENAQNVIESSLKNAGRAHTITKRLGNFAKPSRDAAELEELDVYAYVQECLDLAGRKQLEHDNVFVHVDIPVNIGKIICDKLHLQQILFNLINNSYHAIGHDGNIFVRARDIGEEKICISIEDDGCGIKKEVLDKIWEPFFTTKPNQPSKENKFTGTGLGLSLVKRYVENSDGKIEMESEVNVGTKFFLYFKKADKD